MIYLTCDKCRKREALGRKERQDDKHGGDDEDSNADDGQQGCKEGEQRCQNRKCNHKHNRDDGEQEQCEEEVADKVKK